MNQPYICAVCDKPVDIGTSETNERGQIVHSECAPKSTHREGPRSERDSEKRFAS